MPMLDALAAGGPNPEHADELMLFGQFVGEWDFEWTGFEADGNPTISAEGEWLFSWVLEGRAVQDVWICPSRRLRGAPGVPRGEYGTTVRFYDPEQACWRIVWVGPGYGNVRTFLGFPRDGEIVLEGTPDDEPLHWIFSDITEASFDWRSQTLRDGEWRLGERMAVRRR